MIPGPHLQLDAAGNPFTDFFRNRGYETDNALVVSAGGTTVGDSKSGPSISWTNTGGQPAVYMSAASVLNKGGTNG